MLALRRGRIASVERRGACLECTVDLDGARRPAIGYRELTGEIEPGDDVVVNTAGVDLGLGSGGFDLVHVNLTRGLEATASAGGALKLNYTSLQHAVEPVEAAAGASAAGAFGAASTPGPPTAVLALHGQLEPTAWACARAAPDARIGFVQTVGGALPGALSRAVRRLRERGLLAGHVTVAPTFGGDAEALTVAGALHAAAAKLGWDAVLAGPGPGIVGSASALGHGGLAALDSAHASLALGGPTVMVPRLSSGDRRPRHRGVSHHTATVLDLLLRPAVVAWPAEADDPLDRARAAARHERRTAATDLDAYRDAGLSTRTMGRSIDEDELFFRAALAGGRVLGEELADVQANRR